MQLIYFITSGTYLPWERLSSPLFHHDLKTKLSTKLVTYCFDFSWVGIFFKFSCNTE